MHPSKFFKHVFVCLIMVLSVGLTCSFHAYGDQQRSIFDPKGRASVLDSYEKYLVLLGFRPYEEEIQASRAKRRALSESDPGYLAPGGFEDTIMEFNSRRFRVFDWSREITKSVIIKLHEKSELKNQALENANGDINNPEYRASLEDFNQLKEKIARFTAWMLSFQPRRLELDFPRSVVSSEDPYAPAYHLAKAINERLILDTQNITAELVGILFDGKALDAALDFADKHGQKLPPLAEAQMKIIYELERMIGKYLKFVYLNPEMGQTRYLGRALTLAARRFTLENEEPFDEAQAKARKKNPRDFETNATLWERLARQADRQHFDIRLENFIGDNLILTGRKGRTIRIPLKDGDFLLEKSVPSRETYAIAGGQRPSTWGEWKLAYERGLLGSFFDMIIMPEDGADLTKGLNKWRWKFMQMGFPGAGFSHVGRAFVFEVPVRKKDGNIEIVKHALAGDFYPATDSKDFLEKGGFRLIGIVEQFAKRGPFTKFGRSRLDPVALLRWVKSQPYESKTWQFKGEMVSDGEGAFEFQKSETPFTEFTKISESDYKAIQQWDESRAQEWFENLQKRVSDYILRSMVSEKGEGFDYSFNGARNCLFCSLFGVLPYKRALAVDILGPPDVWHPMVKILVNYLGFKGEFDVDLKNPPINPNHFGWSRMTSKFDQVIFARMSDEEIARASTSPPIYASNQDLLHRLMKLPEFNRHAIRAGMKDAEISLDALNDIIEATGISVKAPEQDGIIESARTSNQSFGQRSTRRRDRRRPRGALKLDPGNFKPRQSPLAHSCDILLRNLERDRAQIPKEED